MKQVCSFIAKWMGAIVLLLAIAAYLRPSLTDIFEAGWITPLLGVTLPMPPASLAASYPRYDGYINLPFWVFTTRQSNENGCCASAPSDSNVNMTKINFLHIII